MAYRSYRRDEAAEELVEVVVAELVEADAELVAAARRRKKQQMVCPRSGETNPRNRRRKF